MTYKIFISHSMDPWDKDFINLLNSSLNQYGIIGYIAENNPEYGQNISEKIKKNIDDSDVVLVLYTKSGQSSQFVNQEIGYALKGRKKCIIIKEKNVKISGLIYGTDIIDYDTMYPQEAITKLLNYTLPLKKSKEKLNGLIGLGLMVGGGYLLYKLLSSDEEEEE